MRIYYANNKIKGFSFKKSRTL